MVYVIDANVVIFYVTGGRNISARCRALLDYPNPADTYILAPLAYLEIWETFIKNPARQNLATFQGATQYIVGNAHATPPVDAQLINILNGPEITGHRQRIPSWNDSRDWLVLAEAIRNGNMNPTGHYDDVAVLSTDVNIQNQNYVNVID